MTDQFILFTLLLAVFALLIWGRWRYDIVAFVALLVALVLIVSRGLSNSGAIELLARFLVDSSRKLQAHIAMMSSLAAVLSAIMNDVAALSLLRERAVL